MAFRSWYGDFSTIQEYSPRHLTGMLDWDNTSIVFTKRTLIEFLKFVVSYHSPQSALKNDKDILGLQLTPISRTSPNSLVRLFLAPAG